MKHRLKGILSFVIFLCAGVLICSTIWAKRNFEFKGFETLWFTITNPINGTDSDTIIRGIKNCLVIPLVCVIIGFIILKILKKIKFFNIINKYLLSISVIVLTLSSIYVFITLDIGTFIKNQINKTTIYEEKYVDPRSVNFNFPENKRNLIFIYLESMESSFYSKDELEGGSLEDNVIPELYEITLDGETFSISNNQGYHDAPGATWTIASDVATTSGVPFKISTNLPGVYTLGDVLNKEGYHNILMQGSDATFANTNIYFKSHGNYEIKDYYYLIKNSYIPESFKDGWGVNDHVLIDFVKQELSEVASKDKPFNFTVATIDTHYEGFECEYCVDEYGSLVLNTLRCSSKLIGEFINWIKEQPFYENTTIVLIGDHESMSDEMKVRIKDYDRKCYFTIINPAIEYKGSRERKISSFDIYPTVLASMGVEFNSDRLGLGTNLYSDTPTLLEEMGEDFFNEVSKSSDYYIDNFVKAK